MQSNAMKSCAVGAKFGMRAKTPVLVAGVVSTLIAASASADFIPANWTLSQNELDGGMGGISVGQTVAVLGIDDSVDGSGTLSSSTMQLFGGDQGVRGITWYSAVASSAGTISVDYAFGNPGGDYGDWDGAGWVLNDVFTAVVTNYNGPRTGTITFSVNAGETFGFGVFTGDGFGGSGAATFTNFVSVTATPAPGAAALIGLAGLVGGRRRKA
jgi:MYXO-CTERM domain-containing protein